MIARARLLATVPAPAPAPTKLQGRGTPAPSRHALVAHVLRRTTFGPSTKQIETLATQSGADATAAAHAAIDWALGASPRPIQPTELGDDGWDTSLRGWVDNFRHPDAGLHEKLTWFWHGHFATSSDKVGNIALLHAQQRLFRQHALGNFAELLHAVMVDPAMLLYLDAAGSGIEAPNENLARELMELFALGRGTYKESDVKAAALALAGRDVDYETGKVTVNPENTLGGEVVFLGRRGRLDPRSIVDIVLARPECAVFIASKLHTYLVGVAPTPARSAELGQVLRSNNYELRPLIESMLHHDDFLRARMNRPKYPVEWFVGAVHALGEPRDGEETDIYPWTLEQLDQLPFRPPNVAGWPPGPKWLSASQQLTRAAYVWGSSWRIRPIDGRDLVASTLTRCGIHECSAATRSALHDAALATAGDADALSVSRRLLATALLSPEFALA